MIRCSRRLAAAIIVLASPMPLSGNAAEAASGTASDACEWSAAERTMAELLETHAEQQRDVLVCDPQLQAFAASRASDMAVRGYFGHLTPERQGPNALLRATGYPLPEFYVGGVGNFVESILAGEGDPGRAWRSLLSSRSHRAHLLGESPVFARQSRFGVAHLHHPESDYAHYWVIVIAEPDDGADRPMTCTPSPPICVVH